MSSMILDVISIASVSAEDPASARYVLYAQHVRPVLEGRTSELDEMYAPTMGRPELPPTLMIGITLLQMMDRVTDREAVSRCRYDMCWRFALNITDEEILIHSSSLSVFRGRLAKHDKSRLVLDAALEAMRGTGYLKRNGTVRIDSTHVLGRLARLSRLECTRETLRLALDFLKGFGGATEWQLWLGRQENESKELKKGKIEKKQLEGHMQQTGADIRDVLAKADKLGKVVADSHPVALLRRVFNENFVVTETNGLIQLESQPAGAVNNPHDPESQWSTKASIGKTGWVGCKTQVCETTPETRCEKGEPTTAVITAVVTQAAITSDHGSLAPVMAAHMLNGQDAPGAVHTDAGYISGPELARAEKAGFDLCGPAPAPPHSGGDRFGTDSFNVDIQTRTAICPAGKISNACSKITEKKDNRTYYYFEWAKADCVACPLRDKCVSRKNKLAQRNIQVGEFHEYSQARRNLCKTLDYQTRLHLRSAIEGTNSELKRGYGLGHARYRGIKKTDIQMQYTAAACNIRRWANRLCWLARKAA